MNTKSLVISPLIALLVICGISVRAHNTSLVVPFSDIPVELDGFWTQDEWNDSTMISFQSADGVGSVYVCVKYYAPTSTLYVAYVTFDETYSPDDLFARALATATTLDLALFDHEWSYRSRSRTPRWATITGTEPRGHATVVSGLGSFFDTCPVARVAYLHLCVRGKGTIKTAQKVELERI
jgi:hypothetical protein